MLETFILSGIAFVRHGIGIIKRPYETYRDIINYGKPYELLFIAVILSIYFAIATVVKTAAFRPFLLTKQFVVLTGWAGLSFVVALCLIWFVGKKVGGKGDLVHVAIAWGYTLIPTVSWFLATSLLFVLFPPPRTVAFTGVLFSVLYLVFSATLLWWKITLTYLTLRFGLRLDLGKIIIVACVIVPVLGFWSVLMYRLGIFKIPFL